MRKHIASVHDGKKPLKYEICDYTCSQKKMKKHIGSVHEGKKAFKCQICAKIFPERRPLKITFHQFMKV